MKKQIVFLATAWGTKHGGINSFNFDLCKAVAAQLQPLEEYEVVCVVLNADKDIIEKAQKDNNIRLISLDISPRENFEDGDAYKIRYIFEDRNSSWQPCWWVGHDVISGSIAIKLRGLHKKLPSKVVIIRHMDYETYKIFQNPTESEELIQEQKRITKDANRVIAIGPYLQNLVQDYLDTDVKCLIPGLLKNVQSKTSPKTFRAITFGRLEPATKVIKQTELTVKAFGVLIKRSHELEKRHLNNAILTLVGIKKDSSQSREMLEIAKEYAGRSVTVNCFAYQELREELIEELSRKTVCLMLSLREGFGLAGWEAIAAEVPIVLSKSSGLYQFLESLEVGATRHVIGIDVENKEEAKNIDTISQHLLAISENPKKYKEQAQELKKILKVYTWERAANDFLEALKFEYNVKDQYIGEPQPNFSSNQAVSETSCLSNQTIWDRINVHGDFTYTPYMFTKYDFQETEGFSGRNGELKWLEDHFHKITESPKCRTLLIKGKTGIGKTCLLKYFAGKLLGEERAYVIIRDFDKNFFEPQMVPQLVTDVCGQYAVTSIPSEDCERLVRLGKSFFEDGSLRMNDEMTVGFQSDLVRLFLKLFREFSKYRPLVIILENIQKASKAGIQFFKDAESVPGEFLIIGTIRSDDTTKCRLKMTDATDGIPLEGLDWHDVCQIVNFQCPPPSLTLEFCQEITKKSDGNPCFILKIIEFLKTKNLLKREEKGWKFLGENWEDLPRWSPDYIEDIVNEQLSLLKIRNERAKKDIESAATIGSRFLKEILEELLQKLGRYSETDMQEFQSSFDAMLEQGLIAVVKDDDIAILKEPGIDTYIFQPPIFQEKIYTYSSEVHKVIAELFEKYYRGEPHEKQRRERLRLWCAHHYLKSRDKEAIRFLTEAIEDDQVKQFPFESIWLLKETLEKFDDKLDDVQKAKLNRNLAQRYSETGRLDDAFKCYKKACKIADQAKIKCEHKDQKQFNEFNAFAIDMITELGWIRVKQADFRNAESFFQKAIERLKKTDCIPPESEWLPAKVRRLYSNLFLEELIAFKGPSQNESRLINKAVDYTKEADELIKKCDLARMDNQRHNVLIMNNFGRIYYHYGESFQKTEDAIMCYKTAEKYFKDALKQVEEVNRKGGHLNLEAYMNNNLGGTAKGLKKPAKEVIGFYQKSLKNTEKTENIFLRTKSLQNLALVYYKQKEFNTMEKYAKESLWYAEILDHFQFQYEAYLLLNEACKNQEGRQKEAQFFGEQAEELVATGKVCLRTISLST